MADQAAADRSAMAQAAQKLDDAANVVKGIQSQLHGHKAQLRSNWDGSAAMAFDRVFQAFDEDFTKVLTAMQGMHEKLVHTRIKYESSEQEQEAAVNKISALLNNS